MNDFVMIPVLVESDTSEVLRDLGIKQDEELEFRAGWYRKSAIIGIYPATQGETNVELSNGTTITTNIPIKQVLTLLQQ